MKPRCFTLFVLLVMCAGSLRAQQVQPLEPIELLSWNRIEALELSPDGQQVAYAVKEPDFKQNRYVKSLWIARTDGGAGPVRLTDNEKDDGPKWSPDGGRIAFLSTREGGAQVWMVSRTGGVPEKLTSAPGGVISFAWAPNGNQIAFITRSEKKGAYEEAARDKDTGIVINKWDFVIYKLFNSALFLQLDQYRELWLADLTTKRTEPLITETDISQIAWSPDSRRIAAVFQAMPGLSTGRTDVMIFTLADRKSEVILRGSGGRAYDDTSAYSSPVWSPDGAGLALFFRPLTGRWQAKSQLGIYNFRESRFVPVPGADRLVLYVPRLLWLEAGRILMETTAQARRRLFSVSVQDGTLQPFGRAEHGESKHSFSKDGRIVAFVRESPQAPPEIYVAREPFAAATGITSINGQVRKTALPKLERVHWKASDGVDVEGWLATPHGFRPERKYPLIVFVHGGPGVAVSEDFDMYMEWPYPYRLAADRGYVTLMPNYRGTGSYSDTFNKPSDVALEPVDDIVTGIRHLIGQGFVDEGKIGIAGHSHGAWLGPQVLTRHPELFRAASFAEGGVNLISAYGYMPGWLNLNIHDYYYGGSPFGALQRYLSISPVFHLAGLTTPVLLEFGDQSLATQGLEFQTGLWRCGVPSELIIYPKTGHNMTRPAQELESMVRNLDWFDYWMLGRKSAEPGRQEQYQRWERVGREMETMRRERPCSPAAK